MSDSERIRDLEERMEAVREAFLGFRLAIAMSQARGPDRIDGPAFDRIMDDAFSGLDKAIDKEGNWR